jgi:adenylate kinase
VITNRLIILLFGPPGCGKGTQAEFIAKRFQIPVISTGELFRAECQAGSRLGKLACSILSSGRLVPDEVVNEMLAGHILEAHCDRGFLLDGYPRTLPQAEFLSGLLAARGLPEATVVHLDVRAEKLIARLSARRQCPACHHIYNLLSQPSRQPGVCDRDGAALLCREDDREEVIRRRLEAYAELTGPVLQHYARALYHRVDGSLAPAEVSRQIEILLDAMTPVGA